MVQGALKLILEPIFEADFQPGSFGYRPKKSAHAAIRRVSEAIVRGMTYVVDLDFRSYFDTVRYSIVLEKVARRVNDAEVLWLLKLPLKAPGKQGVLQGGVISPLLSNVYLNEVDKMLAKAKEVTRQGRCDVTDRRYPSTWQDTVCPQAPWKKSWLPTPMWPSARWSVRMTN